MKEPVIIVKKRERDTHTIKEEAMGVGARKERVERAREMNS